MPGERLGPVLVEEDFEIAAWGLEHSHIYAMCQGLIEAGARLKWVYDQDPQKLHAFTDRFPHVSIARAGAEILDDPKVRLVAAAAIPSQRCALGLQVMEAGKDYFTDKAPFTTRGQLEQARAKHLMTGQKYAVYYSERLHSECALHAGTLIRSGLIGRVINVLGQGPHRHAPASRPPWFYRLCDYGGILCDLGSHQVEQFLHFADARDATVQFSRVANYSHPDLPEFQDFGDALLTADNGASSYFRVDWFTPSGLSSWGDGRTLILGTEGYIELRKNVDIARQETPEHLYLVVQEGEFHLDLQHQVGFPFFGQLILDCLHRTEHAMTQEHAFKAAELSLNAQEIAVFQQPPTAFDRDVKVLPTC